MIFYKGFNKMYWVHRQFEAITTFWFSFDLSVLNKYKRYEWRWFRLWSSRRCFQLLDFNLSGAWRPSWRITSTSSMRIRNFFSRSALPWQISATICSEKHYNILILCFDLYTFICLHFMCCCNNDVSYNYVSNIVYHINQMAIFVFHN